MNKRLFNKSNVFALSILATLVTTTVLLWVYWVSPSFASAANNDSEAFTSTAEEIEQDSDISVGLPGVHETDETTVAETAVPETVAETAVPEVTAETTAEIIVQTLAPVNTLSPQEQYIIENFDIEVEITETTVVLTNDTSKPDDSEGVNANGEYYKYEDGYEYIWDSYIRLWIRQASEDDPGGVVEVCTVVDYGDKEQLKGY